MSLQSTCRDASCPLERGIQRPLTTTMDYGALGSQRRPADRRSFVRHGEVGKRASRGG